MTTTVLDQPEQINAWVFLSAISQLGFEVSTGQNWGRVSVLKAIQQRGWAPEGRATRNAKLLALAGLLHEQPSGPVVDRARGILAEACAKDGVIITFA